MKVRIHKCSNSIFWYWHYIGDVFEVEYAPEEDLCSDSVFKVVHPPKNAADLVKKGQEKYTGLYIQKKDCGSDFEIKILEALDRHDTLPKL